MGLENHRCRYGRLINVLVRFLITYLYGNFIKSVLYSLQHVITQRIKTSPMMLCIVGFLFCGVLFNTNFSEFYELHEFLFIFAHNFLS
jgi:hypothetical protein